MSTKCTKCSISDIEKLNDLLAHVPSLRGIDCPPLDASGSIQLHFANGKELYFEYREEPRSFFAYVPLFSPPSSPERSTAMMRSLLSANYLRFGSGEGEFAFDAKRNLLIFQIAMCPDALNIDRLDAHIEALLRDDISPDALMPPGSARPNPIHSAGAGSSLRQRLRLANER